MYRLKIEEYLPFAPEEPGVVRINHNSPTCSGSSESMRIRRTEDDRVYAKCYRCGGFGSHAGVLHKFSGYAKRTAKVREGKVERLEMPTDFTSNISDLPPIVRVKLAEYFLDQTDLYRFGIGWSEWMNRLIFPVYRDREMIGYQARYYGDDPEPPKYITRYKYDDDSNLFVYIPSDDPDSIDAGVVLVEDMFSAIRCARHRNAVALLGTEMSDKCLDMISTMHDKFLIFLDQDNMTVRKKSVDIRDNLTMLGKHGIIIGNGRDPKEHSPLELKNILDTYLPIK